MRREQRLRLASERLEERALLAGDVGVDVPAFTSVQEAYLWVSQQRAFNNVAPFHNHSQPGDVIPDMVRSPSDLLEVVKALRTYGPTNLQDLLSASGEGEDESATQRVYVDVTGDNFLSHADLLGVVQYLRAESENGMVVGLTPEIDRTGPVTIGDSFNVIVVIQDLRPDDPNPNNSLEDRGVFAAVTDLQYNPALSGIPLPDFLSAEQAAVFFGETYANTDLAVLDQRVNPGAGLTEGEIRINSPLANLQQPPGPDPFIFATIPFQVGAVDDFVTTAEETPLSIDVLGNDTSAQGQQSITTTFVTATGQAVLVFVESAAGENRNGQGVAESDITFGTDTIEITNVPGAPTLLAVGTPQHGTAVIANGQVLYTPEDNFAGTDTFTYTIRYSDGRTDEGQVTVRVTNTPDAPNAVNDGPFTVAANAVLTRTVANEVQTLTVSGSPTGGTFTLSFGGQTTAPIPFNANAAALRTALESLSTIGAGNVNVTISGGLGRLPGGTATITFQGQLAGQDVALLTADTSGLTGGTNPAISIVETTKGAGGLLQNDSDPDINPDQDPTTPPADSIVVTAVEGMDAVGTEITLPSGAKVNVSANGSFTYDPRGSDQFRALAAGQTANDTFTYTISDQPIMGVSRTDTATVTVTVTGVNDAPTAVDDSYETAADEALVVNTRAAGVLGNDTDPDTGETATLTATLVTPPPASSGTLTLNPNGTFTFTPAPGFEGDVTFTYRATDAGGLSDTATVTISVIGQPLRARPDTVSVDEGSVDVNINATPPGITANDETGDEASVRLIEIQGMPVANGTFTTNQGGTITFDPSQTDFRNLVILYTPPHPDFAGVDTFTYTIDDDDPESQRTSTTTVTINVVNVDNDPPIAGDVTREQPIVADGPSNIPAPGVLENSSDPDGTQPTAVPNNNIVTDQGARVIINPDGSFTYDPTDSQTILALKEGETLADSFEFMITDGVNPPQTARYNLTVVGVNDQPIAGSATLNANEDQVLTGNLRGAPFATDPDAGETATLTFAPGTFQTTAGATVTILANGQFTYDPTGSATLQALAIGETGIDRFEYTVQDASGQPQTGTVTLNVAGENDNPVAIDDEFTLDQDNVNFQTLDVLNHVTPDFDIDASDTLTIVAVTQGSAGGEVQIAPDGRTLLYRNAPGFDGTETFTYTISDGNGGTDTAEVTVHVVSFIPSTISGFVYLDKDNDAVRDTFDTPFAGVTVTLTGVDQNGTTITRTTQTDENGRYVFSNLPPSDANGYRVTVAPLPFMVDGPEVASNADDTNAAGNAAPPVGYSSSVLSENTIRVIIPEVGDVASINNNFTVRGLDPRFLSLGDIVLQTGQYSSTGFAAFNGNGQLAFSGAPLTGWDGYTDVTVELLNNGTQARVHATRTSDGLHVISRVIPVSTTNSSGALVVMAGQDIRTGAKLIRFGGSPADYQFTPAPEGEADDYARAVDAIFAQGV